jgi:hypothetical protein
MTHPMSQSCYSVAVWHRLKTVNYGGKLSKFCIKLSKIQLRKISVLSVFFSAIGFHFFSNTATA